MNTEALARPDPQALATRHERSVEEIIAQARKISDVMRQAMDEGVHFGRIQGTPKPTLFKPGAEKLCLLFRLDPQYQSTEAYDGDHLTVKSVCTLWHIPTGQRFGSGEGSCSTRESKYAYRRRGNERIPNPDLPDQYNTVLKMANKRALVAAVLNCTAASDVFTQDLEDEEPAGERESRREEPAGGNGAANADVVISEPQVKRLSAIATGAKWSEEALHELLSGYGYNSRKEIKARDYDPIVDRIKQGPKKSTA